MRKRGENEKKCVTSGCVSILIVPVRLKISVSLY